VLKAVSVDRAAEQPPIDRHNNRNRMRFVTIILRQRAVDDGLQQGSLLLRKKARCRRSLDAFDHGPPRSLIPLLLLGKRAELRVIARLSQSSDLASGHTMWK